MPSGLLPIMPGCRALIVFGHGHTCAHFLGKEVVVVRLEPEPPPSGDCRKCRWWMIEGETLPPPPFGLDWFASECALMRIDGLDDSRADKFDVEVVRSMVDSVGVME